MKLRFERKDILVWTSLLLTSFLICFFFMKGLTRLLADRFLSVEESITLKADEVETFATPKSRDATQILKRNIFDSTQGRLDLETAPTTPEEAPIVSETYEFGKPYNRCDGQTKLVASFYMPSRPEASVVALSGSAGSLIYANTMQVDGKEIVGIEPQRVVLRQNGSLCQLGMFAVGTETQVAENTVEAKTEPETTPSAEPTQGGFTTAELDSNISQNSPNNYSVNRSLINRLLQNQGELMRMARVVPEEGGKGVKIYGVRPNSLLTRLGVKNRDVLKSINGYDMGSPTAALEAYAKLQSSDHITLSVVRDGATVNMDYSIR